MKAAAEAEANKLKVLVATPHPETLRHLFEMQRERVPCTNCLAITNTDVHVDYAGGMAVYTLYKCPRCTHEFMEKDIPRESKD